MRLPRPLGCALLGVAAVVALRLLADAVEPRVDEPAALRWLRAAADHPLRCAAAFALLAHALRRAGDEGDSDMLECRSP
jgi:hypothetical protein